MWPVGSKCILGYSGNWNPGKSEMLGLPGISAPHFCPSQISLVLLFKPSVSLSPDVVIMLPSFSSVDVGYQRPCAVGVVSTKDSVLGSKIEVLTSPVNGISPATP